MTPPTGSYWVHVPVGHAATVPAALAVLDPAARRALKKIESKKGETLGSIASRSGLSAKQLAWYNPKVETLKSGRLRPGQTIAIPAPEVAAAAFDVPDPSIERYGSSSRRTVHVVRRGETLGGIARKYHTTVAHLKAINGLRKTSVFPGQAIVVKGSAKKSSKSGRVSRSRSGAHHASATTKSSPRSKSSPAHAAKKKATKKKAKTRS
jgi:LysM repeat protein